METGLAVLVKQAGTGLKDPLRFKGIYLTGMLQGLPLAQLNAINDRRL